jgi:hypothetical protein
MRLVELFIKEDFDLTDLVYFNAEQLKASSKEVEEYKINHLKDGWENIKLESPPENDSEVTKDELVTITNIQAKRTEEDENSIHVSDKMDTFHFRGYSNTINLWNNLPQEIKTCNSLTDFKRSLETHTFRSSYN